VTSDLAPATAFAQSSSSRMECQSPQWRPFNSIVFKILTSKFFDIKILQASFAEPAPSKGFKERVGRGVPRN
jgi:hypothetical protein